VQITPSFVLEDFGDSEVESKYMMVSADVCISYADNSNFSRYMIQQDSMVLYMY